MFAIHLLSTYIYKPIILQSGVYAVFSKEQCWITEVYS